MPSTFPHAWKVAHVVPVSIHPINILPPISKIVKHIIRDAIVEFLYDNKCLSSSQYGFRRSCSTTVHLLSLTDLIRDSDVGFLTGLDF